MENEYSAITLVPNPNKVNVSSTLLFYIFHPPPHILPMIYVKLI